MIYQIVEESNVGRLTIANDRVTLKIPNSENAFGYLVKDLSKTEIEEFLFFLGYERNKMPKETATLRGKAHVFEDRVTFTMKAGSAKKIKLFKVMWYPKSGKMSLDKIEDEQR